MGLREDRNYLKEKKELRKTLAENARKQEIEDINNRYEEHYNAKLIHEAKADRFYEYKKDVKKTLLTEALGRIYKDSIFHITDREAALCESLIGAYIENTGVDTILKNMRFSKSGLLVSIYEAEQKAFDKITDGANADDVDSQTIDPKAIDDFWNQIDKNNDIEDVTNMIRLRVSNAEEEFVNKNQEDKEDIKSILKDTAERVQNAKATNDNDYSDAVEESEMNLAKDKIYRIQHESYHNVFDRMVRNISESVIKNEEIKQEFTLENGRLDMDKIVESARCMYTLLEMVSTLKIENVDSEYVEEALKSIR
jgi:hypothetical protein